MVLLDDPGHRVRRPDAVRRWFDDDALFDVLRRLVLRSRNRGRCPTSLLAATECGLSGRSVVIETRCRPGSSRVERREQCGRVVETDLAALDTPARDGEKLEHAQPDAAPALRRGEGDD